MLGRTIDGSVLVPATPRNEGVTLAVERVLGVHEQTGVEGVALIELVEPMGSAAAVRIALVPEERVVLACRKARLSPVLCLFGQEEREGDEVLGAGLPVELGVPVCEVGVDRLLRAGGEPDHPNVLTAEPAPEPKPVLEDRPPQPRPVVGDLTDVVCRVAHT